MLLDTLATANGNGNAITDSLGLTKDQLRAFLVDHHVSYTFARDEFVANPEAAIIRVSLYERAGSRHNWKKVVRVKCSTGWPFRVPDTLYLRKAIIGGRVDLTPADETVKLYVSGRH